jgi:hypothetical protein
MIKQFNNIQEVSTIKSFPLVLNIFGEEHIKNYQYFLTQIKNEYDIFYIGLKGDKDQCILFSDLNFDLNQLFPKEISNYKRKNIHWNAVKNFRKYLLGDIYNQMINELKTDFNEEELQKQVEKINKKNPNKNMNIFLLKELTEYDNLIGEIEINKKIKDEIELDNNILKFGSLNNLKYAMKNNSLKNVKKIVSLPNIELSESTLNYLYNNFIFDNYIYPNNYEYNLSNNEFIDLKRIENKEILLDILEEVFKKENIDNFRDYSSNFLENQCIEFEFRY